MKSRNWNILRNIKRRISFVAVERAYMTIICKSISQYLHTTCANPRYQVENLTLVRQTFRTVKNTMPKNVKQSNKYVRVTVKVLGWLKQVQFWDILVKIRNKFADSVRLCFLLYVQCDPILVSIIYSIYIHFYGNSDMAIICSSFLPNAILA